MRQRMIRAPDSPATTCRNLPPAHSQPGADDQFPRYNESAPHHGGRSREACERRIWRSEFRAAFHVTRMGLDDETFIAIADAVIWQSEEPLTRLPAQWRDEAIAAFREWVSARGQVVRPTLAGPRCSAP